MGTRGSVGFIVDGKYKASYNHYDSYPSGLGEEVVKFVNKITKENGWNKFKKAASKTKLVDEDKKPTQKQIEKYKQFSNTSVSTGQLTEWYVLLRELQGTGILEAIYNGNCSHMIDGTNFIKDSLFCEWAYIIDLDKMTLDVYKGFQTEPDPDNIFGQEQDGKYFPCKKIKSVSISKAIPKSFMSKIEKEAYK